MDKILSNLTKIFAVAIGIGFVCVKIEELHELYNFLDEEICEIKQIIKDMKG